MFCHAMETESLTSGSDVGNAWLAITATKCHAIVFILYVVRRSLTEFYITNHDDKCNI